MKSSAGCWIVPKGWPIDGHTDAQTVKVEAWEEAGVCKGHVSKTPIVGYLTEERCNDGRRVTCQISVYRIDVAKTKDTYPEAKMRRRKWMSLKKAAKKVDDPRLRTLIEALS